MTYYERNREKILADRKIRYEKDRAKHIAAGTQYYWKNRDKMLAYQKAYNKKNGITWASRLRELRKTDPAKVTMLLKIQSQKRKARRRASKCDGSITIKTLETLYAQFSFCPYCGVVLLKKNTTLDHKQPLSRGGAHVLENLIPCCSTCNSKKGSMPYEKWLKVMPLSKTVMEPTWI